MRLRLGFVDGSGADLDADDLFTLVMAAFGAGAVALIT